MRRAWRTFIVSVLVCLLIPGLVAIAGCTNPEAVVSEPAQAEASPAVSGPYPIGVAVVIGAMKVTLESVEVSNTEWPYEETGAVAPEGRRWVYTGFAFEGPGGNPAPGGGRFFPQFELVADGKSVPVEVRSSGGDMDAAPGVVPHEYFTFLVPRDAKSVILRVIPKSAEDQVLAFRLW